MTEEECPLLKKKTDKEVLKPIFYRKKPVLTEIEKNALVREHPAVFPELPAPLNALYVKFGDANRIPRGTSERWEFEDRDCPEKKTVEVGLKFTF